LLKGLFLRQKLIEKKKQIALTEHAQQINLIKNYQHLQKLRKQKLESVSTMLPIVN
jgi:aspartate carbamoyltransferase regulatory subunit